MVDSGRRGAHRVKQRQPNTGLHATCTGSTEHRPPTVRLVLAMSCLAVLGSPSEGRAEPAAQYAPLLGRGDSPVDTVLIFQGGEGRLAWTEDQLQGYVTYRDPQSGREQWLFDGFLFMEFRDGRGAAFVGQYKMRSATRADWMWLSDRLFSRSVALDALDRTVARTRSRIGRPARRRKVYLGLPEPILHQKDWGELHGRPLDFDKPEDRLAATRWYLHETIRRWRRLAPVHLDLQGFYWVAEDAQQSKFLLPQVAELVHREQLELIWIPYRRSPLLRMWRALGFDRAYVQPNHFRPPAPDSQLDETCATARALHMGLEVEFDGRAWTDEAYRPRLPAYFARFRAAGALASAPLAWYEGGGAIFMMAASTDPLVRTLYRRLANIVVKRQRSADGVARRRKAQPWVPPASTK
jgi:hypothetical protein